VTVSARTTLCVIQARTGSTRLPGKVLADLDGRPMLRFLLDRLDRLAVDEVVVATSTEARDDAVAEIAQAAGRPVVRGSEADVLDRFVSALDAYPADHVVRITADCPLTDPALVERVVARHIDAGADFTANTMPRTYPKGLDVEVARAEALRAAHARATTREEREHVMPFLYRNPETFRLANVRNDEPLGRERWTVDTADDLEFVRAVCARLHGQPDFGWRDVLTVAGRNETITPGVLALRPAFAADAAFMLACRNDQAAVRHSITGRPIDVVDHARWFAAHLDDPASPMWIGEVDGKRVGTVRLTVRGGIAEIGIAVDPVLRGHGHAGALLSALLDELRGDQQVVDLVARVHPENTASMRAFERVGFHPDQDEEGFVVQRRDPHVPMEKAY
jgi:spore coat polysaccharide biosynthesis protein SpsF